MFNLFILLSALVVISIPLCVGGYIVDKLTPEDEEVAEYEKQVQECKRAKAKRRQRKARVASAKLA